MCVRVRVHVCACVCVCVSPTLHLNQELRLDSAGGFTLVLVPGAAQRVHLVDEDDGGLVLAGQVKQILHQSVVEGEKAKH